MAKKINHSKFRNTGILFELLTRQITADIIAGKEDSEARQLLFKYFKESTELGREWKLYDLLLQEKVKDEGQADRLVNIILEQRAKLDGKALAREKYELIKEVKSLYVIDDFLKTSVRNYRVLASIFKLFECSDSTFDARELYQARSCIVEHVANRTGKSSEKDLLLFYEQQSEHVRLLSYKLLVEQMNKKYESLDDNQRSVLREFINNVSNTNDFTAYLFKCSGQILSKLQPNDQKPEVNGCIVGLKAITPDVKVKDEHVMAVLTGFELIKDLQE